MGLDSLDCHGLTDKELKDGFPSVRRNISSDTCNIIRSATVEEMKKILSDVPMNSKRIRSSRNQDMWDSL